MKKKQQDSTASATKQISVAEALKQLRKDIVVKASGKIEIGPDGEYAKHYQRVRLTSFKDLQRMSLIPEGLDEKKTMEAIARDDDSAFEVVQRMPSTGKTGCDCHDGDGDHAATSTLPRHSSGAMLRAQYSDLRATFNQHLARVLADVYRRDVQWDYAIASHVYRWVDRLVVAVAFDIGTIMIRDITVQKNSTLNIAASTQLVWANNIRIHTGGKIKTTGSYMKIKCASIEGNLP